MTTAAIDTARRLIALAVDPGAAECEARNAAVAACRLIVKNGLLDEPVSAARAERKPRAYKKPRAGTGAPQWVKFPSRWDSSCACGAAIYEGDTVWWRRGERARCSDCGKP